jgi:hypothetical protein
MHDQLQPMVRYLGNLVKRMELDLRFPPNDRLLIATKAAYQSALDLFCETHSLSVKMGAGREMQ